MVSDPDLRSVFAALSQSGSLTDRTLDTALTVFQVPLMSNCHLSAEDRTTACQELLRLASRSEDSRLTFPQFKEAVEHSAVFRKLAQAIKDSLEMRKKEGEGEETWDEDTAANSGPIPVLPQSQATRSLPPAKDIRSMTCLEKLKRRCVLL